MTHPYDPINRPRHCRGCPNRLKPAETGRWCQECSARSDQRVPELADQAWVEGFVARLKADPDFRRLPGIIDIARMLRAGARPLKRTARLVDARGRI